MKKNREMFSGLMAWLVSACFFLGCFANKQLLEKISKLGNSHILIYGITLVLFCLAFLVCMGLTGRMKGKQSYSDGKCGRAENPVFCAASFTDSFLDNLCGE